MKTLCQLSTLLLMLVFTCTVNGQELIQIEVAPYVVPCSEDNSLDCLQILNSDGALIDTISLDAINGFIAQPGYEYTLEIEDTLDVDSDKRYIFKREMSRMWIPQFAVDAPELRGNFKVTGLNGRRISDAGLNIILNANNSVMSGSTGCNNYHLFFKQAGYSLIFSKILATHLYCATRPAMEEEYFLIFNSVHHFELKGTDVLRLYDISDKMLLEAIRI